MSIHVKIMKSFISKFKVVLNFFICFHLLLRNILHIHVQTFRMKLLYLYLFRTISLWTWKELLLHDLWKGQHQQRWSNKLPMLYLQILVHLAKSFVLRNFVLSHSLELSLFHGKKNKFYFLQFFRIYFFKITKVMVIKINLLCYLIKMFNFIFWKLIVQEFS